MAEPLDVDKTPVPGGNVNKPSTGTYGEGAALDRLNRALPGAQQNPPPQAPSPGAVAPVPPGGQGPRGKNPDSPVPGVPGAIFTDTDRPNVPVQSPPPEVAGESIPSMREPEGRLQVIAALQQSPDPETREWANLVMEMLTS